MDIPSTSRGSPVSRDGFTRFLSSVYPIWKKPLSFFLYCPPRNNYLIRAFALFWNRKTRRARNNSAFIIQNSELSCTFVVPEGRNPRVKNAFLALSQIAKSPISQQRDEDKATLILSFAYMQERVQLRLYTFYSYMRQRGVFVSRFISAMVFGDTSYLMSLTSLCAFLV